MVANKAVGQQLDCLGRGKGFAGRDKARHLAKGVEENEDCVVAVSRRRQVGDKIEVDVAPTR